MTVRMPDVSIPVQFLPPLTFSATKQITPTGVKTYPATTAHGNLTITNGSVVSQELPQGLIFTSKEGGEVETDTSVFVPAGSAAGFGDASVSAHTVMSGAKANLSPLSIDAVYGTSLYIRNLEPFTGGEDSYSVKVITTQDRQTALSSARSVLTSQIARIHDIPAHPCAEVVNSHASVVKVVMTCQFVTFTPPPGAEVLSARVMGSCVLLHVKMVIVNHPKALPGK